MQPDLAEALPAAGTSARCPKDRTNPVERVRPKLQHTLRRWAAVPANAKQMQILIPQAAHGNVPSDASVDQPGRFRPRLPASAGVQAEKGLDGKTAEETGRQIQKPLASLPVGIETDGTGPAGNHLAPWACPEPSRIPQELCAIGECAFFGARNPKASKPRSIQDPGIPPHPLPRCWSNHPTAVRSLRVRA